MTIKLGDIARDKLTGFQGVVIAICEYLHQCDRYVVQPQELKDGKPRDFYSFDEPNVELVESRNAELEFAPTPKPRKFGLGDTVKDQVTGFQGVLVSRTIWWNGCDRYSVRSTAMHEGKPLADEPFDGLQLELVESANPKPKKQKSGGPRPNPSRR